MDNIVGITYPMGAWPQTTFGRSRCEILYGHNTKLVSAVVSDEWWVCPHRTTPSRVPARDILPNGACQTKEQKPNVCRRVSRILLLSLMMLPLLAFAHGDETHDDGPSADSQLTATKAEAIVGDDASTAGTAVDEIDTTRADASADQNASWSLAELVNDLSLSDFPTLHPLIVHIPVTLIPIAFLFSVLSLFSGQRIFTRLTLAFTAVGLFGGFLAAFPLHPHTTGLPNAAKLALQKHDFFAYGTLWLTGAALVVALLCAWKPAHVFRGCLSALLLLSTLSVAITGHYGGTLAYVHGIGVQGQFLSPH